MIKAGPPAPADLLKTISMGFIAGGLIFKGLIESFLVITGYSAITLGRKPLKIRPLPGLGGILFEISSFEEQPEPPAKDIIILNP